VASATTAYILAMLLGILANIANAALPLTVSRLLVMPEVVDQTPRVPLLAAESSPSNEQEQKFSICVFHYQIEQRGGSLDFCAAKDQLPGSQCSCVKEPGTSGLVIELKLENSVRSRSIDPGAQADFLKRLRDCCR
jgi:hypothetical protein